MVAVSISISGREGEDVGYYYVNVWQYVILNRCSTCKYLRVLSVAITVIITRSV
jgi:hypothetical protein